MRRSLLLRSLALSLAVALGAVAATAVLATYSTNAKLQGEYETSLSLLEADQRIYAELTGWATEHDGWQGVGAVVDAVARQTGRRIALTTLDGTRIADSAGAFGEQPALPSVPAATIDATGGAGVVVGGTMSYKSAVPGGAGQMVKEITTSGNVPPGSPYWRLTADELARRDMLAKEAVECLRTRQNLPAEVIRGPDGVPQLSVRTATTAVIVGDFPAAEKTLIGNECVPDELYAPSALARRVNADEVRRSAACLTDHGVTYNVVATEGGMQQVIPSDSVKTDVVAAKDCMRTARVEALKPYVAPAARLYLGTDDRFNVFTVAGMLRTGAVALGVLLIAALVTVLAGRRLVRPIVALTGAAQRMTAGDHAARVPVSGNDEVARLGHAFNTMASSIEAAEQQRRLMVSDVAHELRTPLSNIKGYLEASEDGVVPLDAALVRSLQEEAGLLERLVADLQELALADAGMLRLHHEQLDVTELAQQTVAAHRAAADTAGVTLDLDADTPAIAVVDPARIRQALGNLVANAVKFTPRGGAVRVSVRPLAGRIEIAVSDTGPGIGPEHLPHLFDRFYRADPSRSRSTGGSGLGLAITKHLVEAHGGRVDVRSTVGQGSVFSVTLPAR